MKRLLTVIILAGLAWGGHWFWTAHQLRGQAEAWFEARRADGWQAQYDDLSILGFPNRLDATFSDLVLTTPEAGVTWQAPFLQVFRLTYKPDHLILIWPGEQTLKTGAGTTEIREEGLRASLVLEDTAILRGNIEARSLSILSPAGPLALTDVTAALARTEPRSYRFALQAKGDGESTGIAADAVLTFDRPLARSLFSTPRPKVTGINLRLAEFRVRDSLVQLSGDLALDGRGRATGTLTLTADNWRETEAGSGAGSALPEVLRQALSRAAPVQGAANRIDVTLDIRNGSVALDQVQIGQLPSLHLP